MDEEWKENKFEEAGSHARERHMTKPTESNQKISHRWKMTLYFRQVEERKGGKEMERERERQTAREKRKRRRERTAGRQAGRQASYVYVMGGQDFRCSWGLLRKYMQPFKHGHQMWNPRHDHDSYGGGWMVLRTTLRSGINLIDSFCVYARKTFENLTRVPLIMRNIKTFSIPGRQIVATPTGPSKLACQTRHRKKLCRGMSIFFERRK